MGESKKQLKKMPEDVQKQMGGELYLAHRGEDPPHSKMLKGLDSGVFEIRDDFDSNTYRLVYAVQIGKWPYVLHAFQKKSKKGIATPPREMWVNYGHIRKPSKWKRSGHHEEKEHHRL